MPTPAQIEEQYQLEREAVRQGLAKLRDNTRRLEERAYASASVYGISSIEALLPLVVEKIADTRLRIAKNNNGPTFKEIASYVLGLEDLALASIGCKLTFDKVFSFKEQDTLLSEICSAIGSAVESECQLRHYETTAPGLFATLKENYWHRSCGTQQKVTLIQVLMKRYDIEQWKPWPRDVRAKIGAWLLDCIMQVSGWFAKDLRQQGKSRVTYVIPTPEFLAVKDEVMKTAELFAPLAWPMLIEPNDWTDQRPGGYLLNEVMRGHKMVRRADSPCIQGEIPFNFLNKLQRVAYTLNPFIVGVAEELERRRVSVGKFIPIIELPLPNKPVDIADNYDARKDYRRRAAEVMNQNAAAFRRSCRTRMTMESVARFKDAERWYLPWSFDYRGRAYPIPAFLTPQDTDFGKSLIKFADGAFMTPDAEDWLAFQVATTWGLDKAPMSERMEWVRNNHTHITRVATDPLSNIGEWEGAEEPWQFLAACEEYYHCVLVADRQFTSLMVATDATCSGLQILAGLARDASTARLVNVLPSDAPQDAYKVVAEAAKPQCPASIQPYMDRKTVKRVVMTVPYNAKPFSNRGYIREALREKGVEVSKEDLTATVKAVRDAMNVIVPGPMAVMKWIEDEVRNALSRGLTELTWTTPSGFVVNQKIMKKEVEKIQLQVLGLTKMSISVGDSDEVDANRHKAATAPNLIHSLDGSLLHLSSLNFNAPLALIHDSVLCRATDMSQLSTVVRETYMHLFAEHDYLRDFAAQIGAETEPPIIGDLAPESVIESTYFFC